MNHTQKIAEKYGDKETRAKHKVEEVKACVECNRTVYLVDGVKCFQCKAGLFAIGSKGVNEKAYKLFNS